MADVRVVYQPEVGQVVNTADLAAWLATDAGRAAIRAGVRAEWASFATWLHNDGNIFMASKIRQWLAAPREPAQDGGSAAQPQQGAYPPQAQPRGAAGAATCTCGGRLTLQHRAGCSMAREPAQDEPAAGAGPGPLKVTPESMATQLESVASVLVARFMPAESAVCTVGAEMIRALTTPAAPPDARAAGFAEGVEAAAAWHDARAKLERQSGSISGALAEEYAAQAIRALTPPAAPDALLPAWRDVLGERQRQMSVECWTPGHDDEHRRGELALAAAAYCVHGLDVPVSGPDLWPWAYEWWKPKGRRSNLVRSAALLLAEIERLDRAEIARRGGA